MQNVFALIVYDDVLLFDMTKHYGLYKRSDVNLEGYLKVLYYEDVIKHYVNNYFKNNCVKKVEQYSNFLFRICISYLEDFY